MNITLEKKDEVSALLTITFEKADYAERVEKMLKNYRKQANMPGFRPGQVPLSLLRRRFGSEITSEEVNKLIGESLSNYIRENKVNLLGEPMPSEEQPLLNLEDDEPKTISFDIALAPEIALTLSKEDTIDHYTVKVDDATVQNQVEMYAMRAGSYGKVESYQKGDMVKGLLAELDADGNTLEGGVQVEGAVMLPTYIKDEEEQAKFDGIVPNTVITINLHKAYAGSAIELASLLKLTKEEAVEKTGNFSYQIDEITRHLPAEIGQELFDKTFGEGIVKSEEEFRAKITEDMEQQFAASADYKFALDLRAYTEKKVGELHFSEAILKRYLAATKSDKDQADTDKNYEDGLKYLTWHLIKSKLADDYQISVEESDIFNAAMEMTKLQFAQYGMANLADEMIEHYVTEQLRKPENRTRYVDQVVERKLAEKVKEVVTLNEKEVSPSEFEKLFE